MQADTIITGATVITMDAGRRVIRDGAVAFSGTPSWRWARPPTLPGSPRSKSWTVPGSC
ncbi:hypothetical protein ACFSLT_25415 [Novosphingobium resinovorum]